MPTVREASQESDPLVSDGVSPQGPVRPGNTRCPRGSEDVRFSRGGRVGAENGATCMPPIVEPLSDVGAARPLFRVKLSPRFLRSGRGVARPAGGCSCGTRPLLGSRPVAPVLDPSQSGSADRCSGRLPDWGSSVTARRSARRCRAVLCWVPAGRRSAAGWEGGGVRAEVAALAPSVVRVCRRRVKCRPEVPGRTVLGARRPPFCGRRKGRWCPR